MNITAKVLSDKIIIQCKDKPVQYHKFKISKITDSHYENGQIFMDMTINKKFTKEIKKILSQPNIISVSCGDEKYINK